MCWILGYVVMGIPVAIACAIALIEKGKVPSQNVKLLVWSLLLWPLVVCTAFIAGALHDIIPGIARRILDREHTDTYLVIEHDGKEVLRTRALSEAIREAHRQDGRDILQDNGTTRRPIPMGW